MEQMKERENIFSHEEIKKFSTKPKEVNSSGLSKDKGINEIYDQIGNLMKKFANEVSCSKIENSNIYGGKSNFYKFRIRKIRKEK